MPKPILIVMVALIVASGCTNVVYQPSRKIFFTPSEKAGVEATEVIFPSLDGTELHAWHFKAKKSPSKGVIIQFHGNAENMTTHFLSTVWVINYGYDLLTFDYRGYGKSAGSPYPAGVHQDALAVLQKAKELSGGKPKSLVVYGQSLGGAIALRALEDWKEREMIRAIVIESSFLSYEQIARQKLADHWFTWLFQWLAYPLMSDTYSPQKRLRELSPIPLLVIHGTKDEKVPLSHGRAIFDTAGEPKCFWPIESAAHINLMNIEQGKRRSILIAFIENQVCPVDQRNQL